MARPNPKILAQTYVGTTLKQLLIAKSPGVWMVAYKQKPFTLISNDETVLKPRMRKYPKTVFTNPGHAYGLARKLNYWFKSEDFTVIALTEQGE